MSPSNATTVSPSPHFSHPDLAPYYKAGEVVGEYGLPLALVIGGAILSYKKIVWQVLNRTRKQEYIHDEGDDESEYAGAPGAVSLRDMLADPNIPEETKAGLRGIMAATSVNEDDGSIQADAGFPVGSSSSDGKAEAPVSEAPVGETNNSFSKASSSQLDDWIVPVDDGGEQHVLFGEVITNQIIEQLIQDGVAYLGGVNLETFGDKCYKVFGGNIALARAVGQRDYNLIAQLRRDNTGEILDREEFYEEFGRMGGLYGTPRHTYDLDSISWSIQDLVRKSNNSPERQRAYFQKIFQK